MNYLSHGYLHLDSPAFLAGTALPDWIGACSREVRLQRDRLPSTGAGPPDESDPAVERLIRGVQRHLADDLRFHQNETFERVSRDLTLLFRERFGADQPRFRAHFLGHLAVELLLDASLDASHPGLLNRYYETLDRVSSHWVRDSIQPFLSGPLPELSAWIDRFRRARFLQDYSSDEGLQRRIDQVLARVGLPRTPDGFAEVLTEARLRVSTAASALLLGAVAQESGTPTGTERRPGRELS